MAAEHVITSPAQSASVGLDAGRRLLQAAIHAWIDWGADPRNAWLCRPVGEKYDEILIQGQIGEVWRLLHGVMVIFTKPYRPSLTTVEMAAPIELVARQ